VGGIGRKIVVLGWPKKNIRTSLKNNLKQKALSMAQVVELQAPVSDPHQIKGKRRKRRSPRRMCTKKEDNWRTHS
jgi:hypothetical protein